MSDKAPWEMDWGVPIAQAAPPAAASAAPSAAAAPALAGGAAPWEMDWGGAPQAAAPSTVADMAKSGLAGMRNGAFQMVTMPADVRDLSTRALQKMIDLAAPNSGIDLPQASDDLMNHEIGRGVKVRDILGLVPSAGFGPTFPTMSQAATDRGIPDYDPQTSPGGYTKAVGEMVPMALTGGEGVAARLLKNAIAPGIGGQFLGNRFAGSWLEQPAQIAGALTGGGIAHLADAARSGARTLMSQSDAAQAARNLTGSDVNRGAISRLAKDVRNDDLTPEAAETRMNALGPEGMMLDAGRQLQGRAEAIATQPGAGQNTVLNAVEGRTGDFGDATAARIKGTLNDTMGESPDVVAEKKTISDIVDQHAKPLYDSVMNDHPVVNVPDSITSRPAVSAAMKNATTLAKQYGEQLESPAETRTILQGDGYHIADDVAAPAQTSLRYWDYVKKDLDRRVNSYMKSGGSSELNSADKADLGGLINARNALRDHLDDVTDGAYASARNAWATKPQLTEALDDGRSALNTKLLPEELSDTYSNLSIPQQTMYRVGMRREIDRIIDTARNDGGAARRVLDTNQNREKIAALFGNDSAQSIDNRIAAETQFQNATNNIARNSRTAVRQQLQKDTESPSGAAPPQANMMGYVHKGITGAMQGFRDTGMERTRAAIGSLMTTPGAKVPDLVRILAGYNKDAASAARPSATRDAGMLARVLVPATFAQMSQGGAQRQ